MRGKLRDIRGLKLRRRPFGPPQSAGHAGAWPAAQLDWKNYFFFFAVFFFAGFLAFEVFFAAALLDFALFIITKPP